MSPRPGEGECEGLNSGYMHLGTLGSGSGCSCPGFRGTWFSIPGSKSVTKFGSSPGYSTASDSCHDCWWFSGHDRILHSSFSACFLTSLCTTCPPVICRGGGLCPHGYLDRENPSASLSFITKETMFSKSP